MAFEEGRGGEEKTSAILKVCVALELYFTYNQMLKREVHLKQATFFLKNDLRSNFINFKIQKIEDVFCLQKKELIYDIFLSLRNLKKAVILWYGMS